MIGLIIVYFVSRVWYHVEVVPVFYASVGLFALALVQQPVLLFYQLERCAVIESVDEIVIGVEE